MNKAIIILIFILLCTSGSYAQQQADSAFYSYKQSQWLSKKAGTWNVVMTMQTTIDAKPVIIKNMHAERTLVGAFCLNEVMQPDKGAPMPLFKRISDLNYNLNDSRWDYMSIDTRITGGIMNFNFFENKGDSIVSYIPDFPHPGFGPQMADRGKNMKVRNVIITVADNHDIVKQYWTFTDGKEWLAIMYDYTKL